MSRFVFDDIGVRVIEHKEFKDSRGCFSELFRENDFLDNLGKRFVQLNYSRSNKGVFRGLHYQKSPYETGKLIKCLNGGIYDVALNMDKNSKNYGLTVETALSSEENKLIYVPETYAHGILALEDNTVIAYLTTEYHKDNLGVCISYRGLDIRFPIDIANVSEKDANSQSFFEYTEREND